VILPLMISDHVIILQTGNPIFYFFVKNYNGDQSHLHAYYYNLQYNDINNSHFYIRSLYHKDKVTRERTC